MSRFFSPEAIISLLIIAITGVFLVPTPLAMPKNTLMLLIIALITLFLAFASIVWKEGGGDERDNLHRREAGRVSFIVGSALLVAGIVTEATRHDIDPWLIYALSGMILSKIISRFVSERRS